MVVDRIGGKERLRAWHYIWMGWMVGKRLTGVRVGKRGTNGR